MGLLDWIHQQTPTMKGHIAFASALFATGVIALVWTTTLPPRFGAVSKSLSETAPDQVAGAAGSIDTLIQTVTEQSGANNKNTDAEREEQGTLPKLAPESQPSMGALSTLADWRSTSTLPTSTTTYPLTAPTDPGTQGPVSPQAPTQPVNPEAQPTVTPSAEAPPAAPQPRVILIGTTTNAVQSNE